MAYEDLPLIVGAGPVGLGAALFLARQGRPVRIIDALDEPTTESRALAVNPRTLEILEPTGITRQMLELGRPIHGVCFHRGEDVFTSVSLDGIHPRYPFMLALSQASTERLLTRALKAAGGNVERGLKLVNCRTTDEGVDATLERTGSGTRQIHSSPWLFAADGAHSTARDKTGLEFPGSSMEQEWHLADVPLFTTLSDDLGHVFFLPSGTFLFMLPVIDETRQDEPIWRVISNRPEPLSLLVAAKQTGAPIWESSFGIAHRMVSSMSYEGIYFAGDAAHLHSPIGARGMNLGLEDAWIFAQLVAANRLYEYDSLRRSVDKRVVRTVERITRLIAAQSPLSRAVRKVAFPVAVKAPALRGRLLQAITGLDHDLPMIASTTST